MATDLLVQNNTKKSLIEKLEGLQKSKLNSFLLNYLKLFKSLIIQFGIVFISYSILSWIFLGIYAKFGFEKTLIILLVGVFYYGIRGK